MRRKKWVKGLEKSTAEQLREIVFGYADFSREEIVRELNGRGVDERTICAEVEVMLANIGN